MKVLFIGGTGRLSKDVASLALDKGWDVYLLTRGSKERKIYVNSGYHMIYGNVRDAVEARAALANYTFDTVIDFISYNVDQLKNTLSVVDGKYKQFIFISTAGVYSYKDSDLPIREDITPVGNNSWQYTIDKYKCEMYLAEKFKADNEHFYTVIRPSVTYGNTRIPYPLVPQDTLKEWTFMDRIERGVPIPIFDEGKTLASLTHTRDFAVGVVGLFMNEGARNIPVHIANDESVSYKELLETLQDVMEKKIKILEFNRDQIYKCLPEMEPIIEDSKGRDIQFDNSRIKGLVPEYSNSVSLHDGLADMIKHYNSHPELKLIDWEWNGKVDRLINAYGGIKVEKPKIDNKKDSLRYDAGRYPVISLAAKVARKLKRH